MIRKTDKTKEIKETKKEKDRKKDDSIIRHKNKKKERHKKNKKTKETKSDNENSYKNHNELNLNKKNKHKDKHKKSNKEVTQQQTKNIDDKSIKSINKNTFDSIIKSGNYLKDLMEQKYFEINSLDYEDAFKVDHRNFCEYYNSLIKNNHPILFSFASYKDYNIRIIKVFLFFFSFSLDLSINALFFDDDTMHKIHDDRGKYNLLYQIPQILYSTLISRFIDALIKSFSLTQDAIVDLKKEEQKKLDTKYRKKLIRKFKIKFILFFIISFIILLFFWYYVTCFCSIYENTQIHLVGDSFSSFGFSLIYPIIMCLIPGIFRILSLRAEKPSFKILYKFSSFLENYIC